MSAIVDYDFYLGVYMGQEADEASFPALSARAEDVVGAMTRWQVTEDTIGDYPDHIAALYKKAVCAQTDFFAVNGDETAIGDRGRGWTVGKVSVSGRSGSDIVRKGSMSESVSPMVFMYLEQTGLLTPQVTTVREPTDGWWY